MKQRASDDRGAAMVEFVLVLPLLLVLVFGLVEFGRAYSMKNSLQAAAREGARELALDRDPGEVEAAVYGATPHTGLTITQNACPDPDDGAQAEVTVAKDFTFVPALGNLIAILPGGGSSSSFGTVNISATGAMRCGL